MDDFDVIDKELEQEISEAFGKAMNHWAHGHPNVRVPRQIPAEPRLRPMAVEDMQKVENAWFEFKRELIEQVSGFPLVRYYLLCNGEWRLIAVHGRL